MQRNSNQNQFDRSFEDTPTITELSNQDDLFLAVPPGFESMYNRKGINCENFTNVGNAFFNLRGIHIF